MSAGLLPEILDQTGHGGVETERGEVGGKRAPNENDRPAAGTVFAQVKQYGQTDLRQHTGHGQDEGQHHAAHQDNRKPIHEPGTPPDTGHEDQREKQARAHHPGIVAVTAMTVCCTVDRRRDIGIHQNIQDEGHGKPVDRAPDWTERILNERVEAAARLVMQIHFQNRLARTQHQHPRKDHQQ